VDVEAPPKVPTGGKSTLQITVKNKGPGKSVRPVVKYTVPKGISSVRVAVPRHADCAFAGRTLTCTLPNLKSGKSLRITVTGTVDGSARTLRNTVTVVGKNDPRKGNNKDVTEIQVLAASRPRPAHQTAPKPTPKPSDQQACGGPMSRGYSVNRPSGDC
jgi:hypothetical protein